MLSDIQMGKYVKIRSELPFWCFDYVIYTLLSGAMIEHTVRFWGCVSAPTWEFLCWCASLWFPYLCFIYVDTVLIKTSNVFCSLYLACFHMFRRGWRHEQPPSDIQGTKSNKDSCFLIMMDHPKEILTNHNPIRLYRTSASLMPLLGLMISF